jgi:putative ABC transport system permease protein
MFWMKLQTVTREEWIGQKLDVSTWEDELSMMMWTVHALHGLSVVLMLILGLIMIAGISNTLWIAIRERTREIGTLRAIGMRRSGVVRLFLLEAGLLGLLGAVAGVALGSVLSALINAAQIRVPMSMQLFLMRDTVQLSIDSTTLVRAVLGMTLVTGATAVYPALRAGRRKPVDAMAHFG